MISSADTSRLADRVVAALSPSPQASVAFVRASVVGIGGGTIDLLFPSGEVPGVAMTTACSDAKVGDECLAMKDGPRILAIGIIAR